jgi:hypothetical protein
VFEAEQAGAGGIRVAEAAGRHRSESATTRPRALTPAEIAWAASIPCALLTLAAIVVLGPPLGHALLRPGSDALWPPTWAIAQGQPEPVEQGRFLLAVLAPPLYALAVLAASRRPPRLHPQAIRAIVWSGQVGALAFVVLAVLAQNGVVPAGREVSAYFGTRMFEVAAAIVAATLLVMRRERVRERIAHLALERTATRIACAAIAVAFSATWLIEGLDTDRLAEGAGVMDWTLNDAFAVLNGHDPLVDYHLVYAKLLPYPAALALLAFGKNGFVYTLFTTVLSVFALLAVYALLRRLVRSSLLALGLFAPFVALSDTGHTMILPAMWPMRYGGAYLLAWLTARHLDGARPRRAWIVFLVAGVVTINDLEFGLAALLASAAALLCARPPRSARDLARLAGSLAAGLLGAIGLVSILTLARAGALPKPSLLLEWPRIFTNLGWFSIRMPTLGLHLAFYASFVAALGVAIVRLARGAQDTLLTAMLAWSGIFGLAAGGYYAGRSDEIKLESIFSTAAFALVLLTIACVRALAARGWRAPTLAELLVLLGFALSICMLTLLPPPGPLIARLTRHQPAAWYRPLAERFIRPHISPGQKVAILLPEGFRLAYELRLDNVSPYPFQDAIVTRHQMQTLIDALERERVTEVFMPAPGYKVLVEAEAAPEQVQRLREVGFERGASQPGMLELRRSAG